MSSNNNDDPNMNKKDIEKKEEVINKTFDIKEKNEKDILTKKEDKKNNEKLNKENFLSNNK